jgi:hypothetical protein
MISPSAYFLALMIEAETPVDFKWSTWRYIAEDRNGSPVFKDSLLNHTTVNFTMHFHN